MLIAVISDTHIGKDSAHFKTFIKKSLNNVDLIIHLGDFTNISVLDVLRENSKFVGVHGNNDDDIIISELRDKEILSFLNYKIGLYHGHGSGKTTMERAYEKFKDENVDIILFGHSHLPLVQTKNKILFVNPGSLCNKRGERWYSYIILNITQNNINLELKLYENKLFCD